MKVEIANAENPRWANAEHTLIDLDVTFVDPPLGKVSFTASPNDSEQHGRDLFVLAKSGQLGPVAEYKPPS